MIKNVSTREQEIEAIATALAEAIIEIKKERQRLKQELKKQLLAGLDNRYKGKQQSLKDIEAMRPVMREMVEMTGNRELIDQVIAEVAQERNISL